MKRRGYLIEQIADPDNLRLAFWKAQKGKSCKKDVVAFREHLDANLLQIRNSLLSDSYRCGYYHYFTIYDPKKRVICAANFSERVLHHAIMNVCACDFENRQMSHSYACRKGKGTFAALEQAARYQKKYQWYLKLDVRKYFDSIDHDVVFSQLQRMYKDERFLNLMNQIIDSYHASDGKGVPIGNLTSQYFANHYLLLYPKEILLNRRSRNRFAAKLKQYDNLLENDTISERQYAQSVMSLYGFISHAKHKGFASKCIGFGAEGSNRVNRGGSWNNNANNARVSNRNNNNPNNRNNNIGFRIACSSKQQTDFEQAPATFPVKRVKNNQLCPLSNTWLNRGQGFLLNTSLIT